MKKQRLRALLLSAAMIFCGVTANLPAGISAAAEEQTAAQTFQSVRKTEQTDSPGMFCEYGCIGDPSVMQVTTDGLPAITATWERAKQPMVCTGWSAIECNREKAETQKTDLRGAYRNVRYGGTYRFRDGAALCLHGWLSEPRAEFYVIESAVSGIGIPGNASFCGTLTLKNGNVYKIYQSETKGKTPYAEYESYLQYWSIPAKRMAEDVEIRFNAETPLEPHFYAWAMLGMELGVCEQIDVRMFTLPDIPDENPGSLRITGLTGESYADMSFELKNNADRTVNSMRPGDLTGDGKVTREDLNRFSLILRDFFDRHMSAYQEAAADLNGDHKIDARDVTLLKRRLLSAPHSQTDTGKAPDILPGTNRKLIFNDEFNGEQVDERKWGYDVGNWKYDENGETYVTGWGNNEQQFYSRSNVSVGGGALYISARKYQHTDPVQGSFDYTSGKLISKNKFSTTGGRIEVRARCDSGKSLWPAIWMLPEHETYGGWAASGEIDIMEGWGSTPEKICGTIHFGDAWPNNQYFTADYQFPAGTSSADWHVYAVEWEKDCIKWYVDDQLYSTQKDWSSSGYAYPAPFDQDFYLILNLAVGGHFDGVDGVYGDPATFADGEKNFQIDYVRVYEPAEPFASQHVLPDPLELYTEGADAKLKNTENGAEITVSTVGEKEYAVMGLRRGTKVGTDQTYTLKFRADSSVPRDMIVTIEDSAYTRYFEKTCHLTPDMMEYSETVTFPEEMETDLKFQLGNIGDAAECGPHTVRLYDITFE